MSTSNPNRGFEAIAGQIWSPEAHRSSPLPQPDVMIDVAHGGRSACGCMWCAMRENATRRTHFFAAGHGENLPYSRETTHSSCCSDSTRYGFSPQSLASPARLAPVAVARARGQALREGAQFLRRPQRPEHCTFACLTCTRARPLLPAPCSLFCAGRGDALVIFCKRATELLREAFSRPFLAPPFRHAASAMFRHFIFVCGAPFFPSPTLQRAALRTAQSVWRAVHAHVRCVRPRSRHRAHAACLPALVTPPPLLRLPGWSTDRAAVIALPSSRCRHRVAAPSCYTASSCCRVTTLPSPRCRHRAAVTALPSPRCLALSPTPPSPCAGAPPSPLAQAHAHSLFKPMRPGVLQPSNRPQPSDRAAAWSRPASSHLPGHPPRHRSHRLSVGPAPPHSLWTRLGLEHSPVELAADVRMSCMRHRVELAAIR